VDLERWRWWRSYWWWYREWFGGRYCDRAWSLVHYWRCHWWGEKAI